MANNTCRCPLTDKECYAKRGHRGICFLLSEPALYSVGEDEEGNVIRDCKFRKLHQSMPATWTPKTDKEVKWAETDKRKKVLV